MLRAVHSCACSCARPGVSRVQAAGGAPISHACRNYLFTCRFGVRPQVLVALGVTDEPSLHDYLRLLRELPPEYANERLTPSERRALLAVLKLASDCSGFQPSPQLALLTDD